MILWNKTLIIVQKWKKLAEQNVFLMAGTSYYAIIFDFMRVSSFWIWERCFVCCIRLNNVGNWVFLKNVGRFGVKTLDCCRRYDGFDQNKSKTADSLWLLKIGTMKKFFASIKRANLTIMFCFILGHIWILLTLIFLFSLAISPNGLFFDYLSIWL